MATTLGTAEGPAAEPVWPGVGMCRGEGFCKDRGAAFKGLFFGRWVSSQTFLAIA